MGTQPEFCRGVIVWQEEQAWNPRQTLWYQ